MKTSLGPRLFLYPSPILIVGTYNEDGTPNVMNVAWGGICCSQPPCVNISLRKERHSYDNIVKRKAFTLSLPSQTHVREADYFGLVSGRNTNKFAATGLTPVQSQVVDAPYVDEFPLVMECELVQTLPLGTHTMFIGEVKDTKISDSVLAEDGRLDILKLAPVMYATGATEYYGVGKRLAQAFRVGKEI